MENEDPETEDRMLRWIAGAMGFELRCESQYGLGTFEPCRWWFMLRPPFRDASEFYPGQRMTRSFYMQGELLNRILESRTAFLDGGNPLRNPFYGMSRSEIALRMAIDGA